MVEQNNNSYEEFRAFYEAAKELVEKDILSFQKNIFQASDDDEKEFLTIMTNFFLQKRQRQVIDEGLF